jgi:hypothetical protein
MSIASLALNAIGAVAYVVAASPSWPIPEERGLRSSTGEPFIWFMAVVPICAAFSLLNLGWGAIIIAKKQWHKGHLWLTAMLIWIVAISIDFAHH